MIIDALEAADEVLKISHSINNAKDYLKMDDTILNRIVCDNNPVSCYIIQYSCIIT